MLSACCVCVQVTAPQLSLLENSMSKLERTNVHLLNTHGGNRGGVNVFLVSHFFYCALTRSTLDGAYKAVCVERSVLLGDACNADAVLFMHCTGTHDAAGIVTALAKLDLSAKLCLYIISQQGMSTVVACRRPAFLGRRGKQASELDGMLQRVQLVGGSGEQPMEWPRGLRQGQAERSLLPSPEALKQTQPLLLPEQLAGRFPC